MHNKKSFTLIEIMVVVFIIGLLASIVTVSVNQSRIRGRDAKRRADLDTLRTAVELYGDQHSTYAVTNAIGWGWYDYNYNWPALWTSYGEGLRVNSLIQSVPRDPRQPAGVGDYSNNFGYMISGDDGSGALWVGQNNYCIFAHLEQPSIKSGDIWDSASSGDLKATSLWNSLYQMNYRLGTAC